MVDKGDTTYAFKDYTLRELEIAPLSLAESVRMQRDAKLVASKHPRIPKRLRGEAYVLVRRLQKRHYECSYKKLLEYYCPCPVSYAESFQAICDLFTYSLSSLLHAIPEPIQAILRHHTIKFQHSVEE